MILLMTTHSIIDNKQKYISYNGYILATLQHIWLCINALIIIGIVSYSFADDNTIFNLAKPKTSLVQYVILVQI